MWEIDQNDGHYGTVFDSVGSGVNVDFPSTAIY